MNEVIPLERIEREARAAARHYSNVNDACPYPFGSDAGHAFSHYFRQALTAAQAWQEWLADDEAEESPFCDCGLIPTMGERDRNRCANCGKELE